MHTIDATAAKNRFGQLLEACARAPVAVQRHGRVVAYVVGPALMPAARPLEERLADRLRAAGAVYATLFGSVARGQARAESDIDVAVSFGRVMSADLRIAMTGIVAAEARRPVDLIDLESAAPLILARALAGKELVCDGATTRARMATRLSHSEDARLTAARAAKVSRAGLFK